MSPTVADLLAMDRASLDRQFAESEAGPVPDGKARGTMLLAPGSAFNVGIAQLVRMVAWKGKVFNADAGLLRNRILAFDVKAVAAQISHGTSLFDGRECILLDYSWTSLVARRIRDELRMPRPGLYLGRAYWDRNWLFYFALEFAAPPAEDGHQIPTGA